MPGHDLKGMRLRPVVQLPREARPGESYLMTFDLEAVDPGDWEYPLEEYPIRVVLDAQPLFASRAIGEPILIVHRFGGTYGEVQFLLRAADEEMVGEIQVTLEGETGLPVETLGFSDIRIVKDLEESARATRQVSFRKSSPSRGANKQDSDPLDQDHLDAEASADTRPPLIPQVPETEDPSPQPVDIEIRVRSTYSGDSLVLEYELTSPSGTFPIFHSSLASAPIRSPEAFGKSLHERLANLVRGIGQDGEPMLPREIEPELASIGRSLYEQLFPNEFRDLYGRFRERASTLLIVSDETWIPWEVVKAFGEDYDDDFLCFRFSLSRWLSNASKPVQHLNVQRLAFFRTGDSQPHSSLPGVEEERRRLYALSEALDLELYQPEPPVFNEVVRALSTGGFELLHFSGHGATNWDEPRESALLLEDRPLRNRHLIGPITNQLKKDRPFVFMNTEQSPLSWAQRFIVEGRCRGFLGLQVPTSDLEASTFATSFFTELEDDHSVGQAVLNARRNLRRQFPKGLGWIAFSLYAHPNSRIVLGRQESSLSQASDEAPTSDFCLGVQSHGLRSEEVEEQCHQILDLQELFEGRAIADPDDWDGKIVPTLDQFLAEYLENKQAVSFYLSCHPSIAFATGWLSARRAPSIAKSVKQRTSDGRLVEWHPNDGSNPSTDLWTFEDGLGPAAVTPGESTSEVAVAINITFPIARDVHRFLFQTRRPYKLISATIHSGPGPASILGGEHALALVSSLVAHLHSLGEAPKRVHLFGAAPNAFFFFLGQQAQSLGTVVIWQTDLQSDDYHPSIELPSRGEADDTYINGVCAETGEILKPFPTNSATLSRSPTPGEQKHFQWWVEHHALNDPNR